MHACCCRFLRVASLHITMKLDLGMSPFANAYLTAGAIAPDGAIFNQLSEIYVCEHCWLVQLEAFTAPESISPRLCLFLIVLRLRGCNMLKSRDIVEMAVQRFWPSRHQSSCRDRQQ